MAASPRVVLPFTARVLVRVVAPVTASVLPIDPEPLILNEAAWSTADWFCIKLPLPPTLPTNVQAVPFHTNWAVPAGATVKLPIVND